MKRRWATVLGALAGALGAGCTADGGLEAAGFIRVTITTVDGSEPPTLAAPLPANLGDHDERWSFTAEVFKPNGDRDEDFGGVARVTVVPGSVIALEGDDALGRNIQFSGGHAEGIAVVTAMFGAARLWIEDIGYAPAGLGEVSACANGEDDDDDILNDFPNDPGCAFADDSTETEGTLLLGVSPAVPYTLPTVAEVQGNGSETPYPAVAVEIATRSPATVVVTRVASDGFYVTDLGGTGFNHIYAFNFNTPVGMRVCNRITALTGTASEFFGFTEVSFPSYEIGRLSALASRACSRDSCEESNDPKCKGCDPGSFCEKLDFATIGVCQVCPVPEPTVLDDMMLDDDAVLESLESGLVRMADATIARNFGIDRPTDCDTVPLPSGNCAAQPDDIACQCSLARSAMHRFIFSDNASNCDLNLDGQINFFDDAEGACANDCSDEPDCSEWIGFDSRGNYKVHRGDLKFQINTGTAQGFDPKERRGQTLIAVSGTLRNFSGGSLNWTIETRCSEDLVCDFDDACAGAILPSSEACITPATEDDNDSGTN